jgi:uncharacterized protein (TIGR00299 family) protein
MSFLHFDSVGGASGDMILGALIELGVDAGALQTDLQDLTPEPLKLEVETFSSHGLHGIQVTVRAGEHQHHDPHHGGHHHHAHRGLRDIRAMIEKSALPDSVKEQSVRVFTLIAEVEARIHGTTMESVHFHEVGALDSIADIVGCCLALHRLGVEGVAVGPLPVGQGTIKAAHGVLPNPAPATVELLKGMAVTHTDEPFELVTPTGAALLATWKTHEAPPAGSRVVRTGYSFGHHVLRHRPNLLRALLLDTDVRSAQPDVCHVLECNIDDTTPELLGSLVEQLLLAGAYDAFTTSIQMKKQRPGTLLTVLCETSARERLLNLVFRETTTFGVREYDTRRTMLERRWVEVETPFGSVRIKIGRWRNEDITFAPEMDDCIRRARENSVPVRLVYEHASRQAQSLRQPR